METPKTSRDAHAKRPVWLKEAPTQQTSLALLVLNRSSHTDPFSFKSCKGEHASHLGLQGLCPGGLRTGRLCSSVFRDPSLQFALLFSCKELLLQLTLGTFCSCLWPFLPLKTPAFALSNVLKVNPKLLAAAAHFLCPESAADRIEQNRIVIE